MRHIKKGSAAFNLKKRNMNPPTSSKEAKIAWKGFNKFDTRNICLIEQYGLCGYSEIPLYEPHACFSITKELGMHIEHIKPKSTFPALTFEHNNLIVSAISEDGQNQLPKQDLFGGRAKRSWYHPEELISPLNENCSDYFHYNLDGKITPKSNLSEKNKETAKKTIEILNLNSPSLVVWRKAWIEEAHNIITELLGDNDAIKKFAETELSPSSDFKLRAFHTAILNLFGKHGEIYKI